MTAPQVPYPEELESQEDHGRGKHVIVQEPREKRRVLGGNRDERNADDVGGREGGQERHAKTKLAPKGGASPDDEQGRG